MADVGAQEELAPSGPISNTAVVLPSAGRAAPAAPPAVAPAPAAAETLAPSGPPTLTSPETTLANLDLALPLCVPASVPRLSQRADKLKLGFSELVAALNTFRVSLDREMKRLCSQMSGLKVSGAVREKKQGSSAAGSSVASASPSAPAPADSTMSDAPVAGLSSASAPEVTMGDAQPSHQGTGNGSSAPGTAGDDSDDMDGVGDSPPSGTAPPPPPAVGPGNAMTTTPSSTGSNGNDDMDLDAQPAVAGSLATMSSAPVSTYFYSPGACRVQMVKRGPGFTWVKGQSNVDTTGWLNLSAGRSTSSPTPVLPPSSAPAVAAPPPAASGPSSSPPSSALASPSATAGSGSSAAGSSSTTTTATTASAPASTTPPIAAPTPSSVPASAPARRPAASAAPSDRPVKPGEGLVLSSGMNKREEADVLELEMIKPQYNAKAQGPASPESLDGHADVVLQQIREVLPKKFLSRWEKKTEALIKLVRTVAAKGDERKVGVQLKKILGVAEDLTYV